MQASNHTIRALFIAGPAGRLEALLNQGTSAATHAALVCHPHPLFAGTMHNKVVFHAMKALNSFGFPVLRFNFRGVDLSEGEHDYGDGEIEDVRAALEWLAGEFPLPIIFCGFSFGAAIGSKAACAEPLVVALISLGTPIRIKDRAYGYGFLQSCAQPKLFISGDHDQFAPGESLTSLVKSVSDPKKLVLIRGADHFFTGKLAELRAEIEQWVRETIE